MWTKKEVKRAMKEWDQHKDSLFVAWGNRVVRLDHRVPLTARTATRGEIWPNYDYASEDNRPTRAWHDAVSPDDKVDVMMVTVVDIATGERFRTTGTRLTLFVEAPEDELRVNLNTSEELDNE